MDSGNQNLNQAILDQELLDNNSENEDDDLLFNDNQENEIENLINQQNLQILDDYQSSSNQNNNSKRVGNSATGIPIRIDAERCQVNPRPNAKVKHDDSNEFEFEQFMREHEINLHHKIDSDRSQFTQESCSPPDSARDHQLSFNNNAKQNQNQQQLIEMLQGSKPNHTRINDDGNQNLHNNEECEEEKCATNHQQISDSFSLMQSPNKDSFQEGSSFQGQLTSNFPQNLKDTALYKLRDPEQQQQQQNLQYLHDSMSRSTNQPNEYEEKSDGRLNSSSQRIQVQKIKDFEKSNMIKFEEFNGENVEGGGTLESDPNRKLSERISDRIYERVDTSPRQPQKQIEIQEVENNAFQQYFATEEESQRYSPMSFDKGGGQQNLFIIKEEVTQEDNHSSYYHAYNRLNSGFGCDQQDIDLLQLNSQSDYQSRGELMYQKSKSQPINKIARQSIHRTEKQGERLKTDVSPNKKMGSQSYGEAQQFQLPEKQNTRVSAESPYLKSESEQLSVYFQRIHSNQGLRKSSTNQNNTQVDFIISEEDLLSNVDRISKCLPTNEINEEAAEYTQNYEDLLRKLQRKSEKIKRLKIELQKKDILLHIKEDQVQMYESQREEYEQKIQEMKEQLMQKGIGIETKDAETQINEFERKKIREKRKPMSGSKRATPSRVDSSEKLPQEHQDFGLILKSQNNAFDTPQLKNDSSFKETPSTSKRNTLVIQRQQSLSFSLDELNQKLNLIKAQLKFSEENNLSLQQRIERIETEKNFIVESNGKLKAEKEYIEQKYKDVQAESKIHQMGIDSYKAEIVDLKRQIDMLKLKYEQPRNVMDKNTSSSSIQPFCLDQGLQTDFIYTNKNKESSFKPQIPFRRGSMRRDVFEVQEKEHFDANSSISSKSLNNNNITIINHKQDLNMLLEKAKDYEQISLKLQNEINEHRKLLKTNKEKMKEDIDQQKEYKKKLKKREAKIEKYRQKLRGLEKENTELKVKIDELNQKNQDIRIKMETKIQEKEFKIMSMKNQMKHFSMSSGLITPATPVGHGGARMYSQHELYNIVNSFVQQSFIQKQQESQRQETNKMRAKSQDQPYQNVGTSFYDEAMLDDPKILTPNNVLMGDNPSFCNYDNQVLNAMMFSNQKDKVYSTPSVQQVSTNKSFGYGQQSQQREQQPLQQIFNSSMRRINQELESIKDINSATILRINNNKMSESLPKRSVLSAGQGDQQPRKFTYQPKLSSNNVQKAHFTGQSVIFEDSLQSQKDDTPNEKYNNELLINDYERDDGSSEISSYVDNKIDELRKKRLLLEQSNQKYVYGQKKYQSKGDNNNANFSSKKANSMQNTHTFRQISSQNQNSPSRNFLQHQLELSENQIFNNTQGFAGEKEQNVSIFDDFKPQFDNSNFINTSTGQLLNQTSSLIRNSKNAQEYVGSGIVSAQPIIKFESQQQSLNNSVKHTGGYPMNHIRLNSNMRKDAEIEESSDEMESSQNSNRRRYRSSNAPPQRPKYSAIVKYDEKMPRHSQKKSHIDKSTQKQKPQVMLTEEMKPSLQINQGSLMKTSPKLLIDGSKSTLSNYSQKLDDLKKKYGRIY